MGYIYKITNLVNGKIYIGKTINLDSRLYKHKYLAKKGNSRHLYSAMRKYGIENFSYEVVEECDASLLNDRERYWINAYNSTDRNIGYNKTNGGDGGDTWSLNDHKEATSKLLSEKLKGITHDPDSYYRGAEKRRGAVLSEEQKKKISETLRAWLLYGQRPSNRTIHHRRHRQNPTRFE